MGLDATQYRVLLWVNTGYIGIRQDGAQWVGAERSLVEYLNQRYNPAELSVSEGDPLTVLAEVIADRYGGVVLKVPEPLSSEAVA